MTGTKPTFSGIAERAASARLLDVCGRVTEVAGLVIQSNGPNARIGDVCQLEPGPGEPPLRAEVVGFRDQHVLMMPLGQLVGVKSGCIVRATGTCLQVPVGEALLGRAIDGLGAPIDGKGPIHCADAYPVIALPPNPLERRMISEPFETGVRAIDSVITMGIGQRMGIFSGSGVGKSTLLGMIARNGSADVNVVALVGERGREVREFIESDLGEEGMARTVVVCATSDEPALVRIKAALTATAICEYFRDKGLNVLLMMDSITRFAMAQREVGLAIGEPPSAKGYTPSVFALLPRLLERAGCGAVGAITALFTVLVEGDDTNEPISDAARSILDGHIVLDRKLTGRGHYPPIDVTHSLSRVMAMVAGQPHVQAANALRELIGAYAEVEDLISIGAYKPGSKPTADQAIARWPAINRFLRQGKAEAEPLDCSVRQLTEITKDI